MRYLVDRSFIFSFLDARLSVFSVNINTFSTSSLSLFFVLLQSVTVHIKSLPFFWLQTQLCSTKKCANELVLENICVQLKDNRKWSKLNLMNRASRNTREIQFIRLSPMKCPPLIRGDFPPLRPVNSSCFQKHFLGKWCDSSPSQPWAEKTFQPLATKPV